MCRFVGIESSAANFVVADQAGAACAHNCTGHDRDARDRSDSTNDQRPPTCHNAFCEALAVKIEASPLVDVMPAIGLATPVRFEPLIVPAPYRALENRAVIVPSTPLYLSCCALLC